MKINATKRSVSILLLLLFGTNSVTIAQNTVDKKNRRTGIISPKGYAADFLSTITKAKSNTEHELLESIVYVSNSTDFEVQSKTTYSYSEDGNVVTGALSFYLGEDTWFDVGAIIYEKNDEGYPISLTSDLLGSSYSQSFYYDESLQPDSVIYEEQGEDYSYWEKISFEHVTADSIHLSISWIDEDEIGFDNESYFINKDGNYIEYYVEEDFTDRYTYSGVSFSDVFKNAFNEFFFVEVYNDELYSVEEGFIPYSRNILEKEDGKVVKILEEYYDADTWLPEYDYLFTYEAGTEFITQRIERYFSEDIWYENGKTEFIYSFSVSNEIEEKANSFKLSQNYPNPFNPTTSINFDLLKSGFVSLKVYNILGAEVKTLISENISAGQHSVSFDATNLPSGIYYYTINTNNFSETKSMSLIK